MTLEGPDGPKPLEGLVVIDLTTALAGPYATLLLAGLGAEVIKVESPRGGDSARGNAPFAGEAGLHVDRRAPDDLSLAMLERGRNKLGVTLDLKHPRAREVFGRLVRRADVVVENYAAGTADRLGIGYAFARTHNERILYCSISGFGAFGPGRSGKAMDTIIQALSGAMSTSGSEGDDPVRFGVPVGDLTGPLFAVIGVLAALQHRERTGHGQHIDVSLLGALTSLVAIEPFDAMRRVGMPVRTGRTMSRLAPFGVFAARDGEVAICAPTDVFAMALFRAMQDPELAADPRYATRGERVQHADAVHARVARFVRERGAAEVVELLTAAGVPAAKVREPAEAVVDPRVVFRGETAPLSHPTRGPVEGVQGSGVPIRFSESRAGYDRPAPFLGEHNHHVYGELCGYTEDELNAMVRDGVV